MSTLNLLLAAIIVYIPYQSHYRIVFDIPGLNLINLMFLGALTLIMLRKGRTLSPTPLKAHLIWFIVMLVLAFFIGQFYEGGRVDADAQALKNAIFYMLFYFLFFHAARDVKDIRFLLGALLFVTLLVSLQVFRQALDYGLGVYNESRRAGGPFATDSSGANLAAAFFVIFLPLFLGLALHRKSALTVRLIAMVLGVFGVFSAFFTYSRQAYIILALLLSAQAIRRNILVGLLLGVAVLTYESWVPEGVVDRIEMTEQKNDDGEDKKLDESTESRFILWEGAMNMIAERPWGVGLNHFAREMGKYVPGYAYFDVHNGYLLVATETGVVGALVLITLLIRLFLLGRRVEKLSDSEDARVLGSTFQISVLAAMLANLFGSRFFNGEVMGNFWILSGLVARYYTLELERRVAPAPSTGTSQS
jgi:O-antigen ligase